MNSRTIPTTLLVGVCLFVSSPSAGSKVAIDALLSVNYNLSGITSMGFKL